MRHSHEPTGNYHPLHRVLTERITSLSYTTLFTLWIVLVVGFAVLYALLAVLAPAHAPSELLNLSPLDRLGESIYYSIITATTTGYGDIVPQGFSKVLASIECIAGVFIFAMFITKLVSQQQEIAVKQVHRHTYEDVFHNTREGLYIIRRDFDRIIEKLERGEALISEDWEDLATAFKQGQSLLLEIPEFYDTDDHHLYTIDERREQLLEEAVHRTLHRINQLIDAASIAGVDFAAHGDSVEELRELLRVVETVAPLWHTRSPYQRDESYASLLRLKERAMNRVNGMAKKTATGQ